ncbi:MAG: AAA family ATPase [Candidatus Spechtbacteria bacterium]|nr:AAA family ATPase [Candidatus Spechtbacteria bacterium]
MRLRSGPRILAPEELYGRCDPAKFADNSSAKGPPVGFIGQENACASLEFGLTELTDGYNIMVINPNSGSRRSVLREVVREILNTHSLPYELHDYCYVHNFATPERPSLVILPAGRGKTFHRDVLGLFQMLSRQIPEVMSSFVTIQSTQAIQDECEGQITNRIAAFSMIAEQSGLTVYQRTNPQDGHGIIELVGIEPAINPETFEPVMTQDGRPQFVRVKLLDWVWNRNLSDDQRSWRHQTATLWGARFQELSRLISSLKQQTRKKIDRHHKQLINNIAENSTESSSLRSLRENYPEAREYLTALRRYIFAHINEFMSQGKDDGEEDSSSQVIPIPFVVNVYVENDPAQTQTPIIKPSDFTPAKFIGTFNTGRMPNGMPHMDHTKMTAGDVARANGCVLIIDDALLKSSRGAVLWRWLIKTLHNKTIEPEDDTAGANELLGISSSTNFRPQLIPLQIKVVFLVDRRIYYDVLVKNVADQLDDCFRVQAELSDTAPRTDDNEMKYKAFIDDCQKAAGLLPFDATAIAQIVQYSSRMSGDKEDLALDMREVKAICLEANRVALDAKASIVTREHVQQGAQRKRKRTSLVRNKMFQLIERDMIIIHTEGKEVGRGNGLAVFNTINDQFGLPMTVTSRKFYGSGFSVLFLDSQAKATGKSFEKAAGTIETLLKARYGEYRNFPIAVSISFEQNYGGIDGDSASVIEWLVAVSAIGNIPLRQDIAITGSLGQHGQVQPIGGVNEKIEGFFDVCSSRGLNGQVVLIPEHNVRNLALRHDVVEACALGKFHVMAYSTPEQVMEFASGISMEEVDKMSNDAIEQAIARAKEQKEKAGTTAKDEKTEQ